MSALGVSGPLLDFLEAWEGRELEMYQDSAGLWTIGVGHLIKPDEDFTNGLTDQECDDLLVADCTERIEQLNRLCVGPTNQQQFDALFSLGFNIGLPRLTYSSALKRHNAGYTAIAADAILLWDKVTQGAKLIQDNGLAKRRWAERQIYKFGDYSLRP
jgi:lysozyme